MLHHRYCDSSRSFVNVCCLLLLDHSKLSAKSHPSSLCVCLSSTNLQLRMPWLHATVCSVAVSLCVHCDFSASESSPFSSTSFSRLVVFHTMPAFIATTISSCFQAASPQRLPALPSNQLFHAPLYKVSHSATVVQYFFLPSCSLEPFLAAATNPHPPESHFAVLPSFASRSSLSYRSCAFTGTLSVAVPCVFFLADTIIRPLNTVVILPWYLGNFSALMLYSSVPSLAFSVPSRQHLRCFDFFAANSQAVLDNATSVAAALLNNCPFPPASWCRFCFYLVLLRHSSLCCSDFVVVFIVVFVLPHRSTKTVSRHHTLPMMFFPLTIFRP